MAKTKGAVSAKTRRRQKITREVEKKKALAVPSNNDLSYISEEDLNFFLENNQLDEPLQEQVTKTLAKRKTLLSEPQNITRLSGEVKVGNSLYLGGKKTPDARWKEKFLYKLAETGKIKLACEYADVSRGHVQRLRDEESDEGKEFAEFWKMAKQDYLERMEIEADRRGINGIDEPVFYKGVQTGIIKRYSDTLLLARLKAEGGDKYRDGTTINNSNQQITQVVLGFAKDDKGIFTIE